MTDAKPPYTKGLQSFILCQARPSCFCYSFLDAEAKKVKYLLIDNCEKEKKIVSFIDSSIPNKMKKEKIKKQKKTDCALIWKEISS